jgi:hypothetical protein
VILGGFSTDKDLFMELFYLFGTINEIESKLISNKNKILLLVDPWHQSEKEFDFGVKVFNWRYEEQHKVMAYSKVNHELVDFKVSGSSLHSQLSNKEELLLHLNSAQATEGSNTKEILEELRKSVDENLKIRSGTESISNNNLYNLKKQILLTEKFLGVVENYLNGVTDYTSQSNQENLFQIDYLLHTIISYFESEEVLKIVEKEFRENQIIDSLTNLLNVQVRITEKINKFNL